MKKIKIFLISFGMLAMLCTAGCNKVLDVKTVSSITNANYWKAEGDVTGYLTGIYTKFRSVMNTTYYLEDRGDSYVPGLEVGVSNAWLQNLTNSTAPNWVSFYNLIHHCNLLLKYGKQIPFSSQQDKDRVFAETYFIRAFTYFTLLRSWGDVPLVLEPTESGDQPMVGRSPATTVMQQVLKDVDEAIALFPENGFINKSRASKPACYALKADAFLWKAKVLKGGNADLDSTLMAISKVQSTVGLALESDFSQIFSTANRNGKEIVFSIHFLRDEESGMYARGLKARDIFVNTAKNKADIPYAKNGARSNYAPSPKLISLFDENANDQRKAASVVTAISATGGVIGVFGNKFRGTLYSDDRYFDNDIIVYRLGGLILMKAEALAALDRIPDAITALNQIRVRAHIGDYAGAMDKKTVEKAILDERFRELWNEQKRWPDLVRFNAEGIIDVYQEVPNLEGKHTPLYFPIPLTQIDINPKLKQTEGY
ncbi:MAG TPA: RagB/SusD family nutrient uptake outer membrane protein [Chitinophagaceae bacterium]|jgi:hypothetical protein|nr:RagB/SusD family nutrient uptake outer membrane protein [Chitinophagaceae bacterium]